MQLCVNGHVLPIAQLGPDFLILRTPIDHPPIDAEIFLSIDGHEDRWAVRLSDGIKPDQRLTPIARPEKSNGSAGA